MVKGSEVMQVVFSIKSRVEIMEIHFVRSNSSSQSSFSP